MTTKAWSVFVLVVASIHGLCPGTNTLPSTRQPEHGWSCGSRPANDHGRWKFMVKAVDFAGYHWSPLTWEHLTHVELSVDIQNKVLLAVNALVDNLTKKDCGEIFRGSSGLMESGIYAIYPGKENGAPVRVFCRVEDGQAWTVLQRRQDGSVDFYNRTWEDYRRGFGDLTGEFWLGNDNIYLLTNQARYQLQVYLRRFNGEVVLTEYDSFRIDSNEEKYRLHLGAYMNTGVDYLSYQNGCEFVTKPCANMCARCSCYLHKMGGFWVSQCDTLNPNGNYHCRWDPGVIGFQFVEMRIIKTE